jgi:hypothetical protein
MGFPIKTVPVWNETCSAEDRQDRSYSYISVKILSSHRFQMTYYLLCRWQTELEFFLYQFCKTAAPGLIDDCHWSCPEAAELTRLSEEVTEFFCFHHKTIFKQCGISEQDRESFCCELQETRQIRHFAVHRVDVNAATINKYAKCALNVLGTVKRLGGQGFEKDHGEAVCPVPFPSHYNFPLTTITAHLGMSCSWTALSIVFGKQKGILFRRRLFTILLLGMKSIILIIIQKKLKGQD